MKAKAHIWLIGELLWGALVWCCVFGPVLWKQTDTQDRTLTETKTPPVAAPERQGLLNNAVRRIDGALAQTLGVLDQPASSIRFLAVERYTVPVEVASEPGDTSLVQRLQISLQEPVLRFLLTLRHALKAAGKDLFLSWEQDGHVALGVNGLQTHELELIPEGNRPATLPSGSGRLALVLYDNGTDELLVQDLLALKLPVAVSFAASGPSVRNAADAVYRAGGDVLVQLPLESRKRQASTGIGNIASDMSSEQMLALEREALRMIPHAVGVSTTGGEQFVTDRRAVQHLCQSLARNGVFLLDTVPHPASLLHDAAPSYGVMSLRRTVRLDGRMDKASVRARLEEAARYAEEYGQAVAVGRLQPVVLEVLREWKKDLETLPLIPLRQLVWSGGTGR